MYGWLLKWTGFLKKENRANFGNTPVNITSHVESKIVLFCFPLMDLKIQFDDLFLKCFEKFCWLSNIQAVWCYQSMWKASSYSTCQSKIKCTLFSAIYIPRTKGGWKAVWPCIVTLWLMLDSRKCLKKTLLLYFPHISKS